MVPLYNAKTQKEVAMSGELAEIEAIKRLKYKYLRCVDCKLWDELAKCFTPDATTSFSSGKYSFKGVGAIVNFLRDLNPTTVHMHHGHHPEIELTSDTTATGTWALEDYVIMTELNMSLHGAAFYHDEYVKVDGDWKIKHTGYERVFEETWNRADIPSLNLMQNMHAPK
jgi:bile-acid 7alpha-dehydratase